MKIWCQSCGAFGKDPLWNDYEKALMKRAKEVARPDTVVDLHGQEATIPGIDRYQACQSICGMQSARNAIRAEREGYDAFVQISTLDAGFNEIKELVDIPVVFMLEFCLHFAMMLAPKFAFLAHNDWVFARLEERAKQYGLAERMVRGGYLNLNYSVWPDLFGHPQRYTDIVTQKAREIVSNGANILIPSPLPLAVWLVQQGLTEIDGARVFDDWGASIKMAELMVDLKRVGISKARYGSSDKEMLEKIQRLYV